MNFLQIYKFVNKKTRAGENVTEEKVELNYRFSYPIITMIILLITLPLSVVLKRGGIAIGLGISIVLAFVYWGAIQSCRAYGVKFSNCGFIEFPNIIIDAGRGIYSFFDSIFLRYLPESNTINPFLCNVKSFYKIYPVAFSMVKEIAPPRGRSFGPSINFLFFMFEHSGLSPNSNGFLKNECKN